MDSRIPLAGKEEGAGVFASIYSSFLIDFSAGGANRRRKPEEEEMWDTMGMDVGNKYLSWLFQYVARQIKKTTTYCTVSLP